jgi:parallel beta-helix repeat protein
MLELKPGMVIKESVTIQPGQYEFNGADSLDRPVITIMGKGIVVDFNGAELIGSNDKKFPNEYYGLGLRVEQGSHITIKNIRVRGYKVGLLATGIDSLKILNSDFGYNYRPRLGSTREREDLADWLSYHQNEEDEWLRYGAGMYLKNCHRAMVKDCRVTGGQNGLLLTGCEEGLFYNNTFHFNSGLGIGLYRSSDNRIMHNRLDWNVRGYSYGFYSRGQDSAGILCYEQSQRNIFAYNSATHSGDGFFLWAGRQTIDTGEGGCNDNIVYGNDFSYAPANGIEVTFSRNEIVHNKMEDCRYGIWGGYSYGTLILANKITGNDFGVAIENGNTNNINANVFRDNETGIQLWERDEQPRDLAFAERRNVRSRDYQIRQNIFQETEIPLRISHSNGVEIIENFFLHFDALLKVAQPNEDLELVGNTMNQTVGWGDATPFLAKNLVKTNLEPERPAVEDLYHTEKVRPLKDGKETSLPDHFPQGRSFILVDEWGPYDFRRPSVWLRGIEGDDYIFLLLGPQGNWKLTDGEGFEKVNPKTGTFPATVTARKSPGTELLRLDFEFIGEEVITQFGEKHPRGTPIPFSFFRFEHSFDWWLRFYEYEDAEDPLENYQAFRELRERKAGYEIETDTLGFSWWDSPGGGIRPDRFATFAESDFIIPNGTFILSLTSDDGVRLYLDGELIIDHWDVHTPATDEAEVRLGGQHHIEIEHFDAEGLATLDFRIKPVMMPIAGEL